MIRAKIMQLCLNLSKLCLKYCGLFFSGHGAYCCSCCCFFLLGRPFQKAQVSVVSNRIRMKFGSNVLLVNKHRLTGSNFWFDVKFQNGDRDVISHWKVLCCHLLGENEASSALICSSARQLLICSIFGLVYQTGHLLIIATVTSHLLPAKVSLLSWADVKQIDSWPSTDDSTSQHEVHLHDPFPSTWSNALGG